MDSDGEDYCVDHSDGDDYFQDNGSYISEEPADDDGGRHDMRSMDMAEPDSAAATVRHKPYKIFKEEEIKHLLQKDISTVSDVLSVPRGAACALLCKKEWNLNSAYEHWFAAVDDGLTNPNPAVEHVCKICYENTSPENTASAACGHPFCTDCWRIYIATAVSDGAACLKQHCPEPGCRAAVTFDMVDKLASEAVISKYNQHLLRSYIELNRNRKWCPAAGCDLAVEFDGLKSESYDVVCDCSHEFCWNCREERHRPVRCEPVAEWAAKNISEEDNQKWLLAYTKQCSKCRRAIQKNEGCNHMTCRPPCGYEFCWICGGAWSKHNNYYACNMYAAEKKDDVDESIERAKIDVERYMHYFERWFSNDKSRKIAMNDLVKARERYGWLPETGFVLEAWGQIVECRRVLKWSYVYGYYLEEDRKKALFEFLQAQAEGELERLHYCVEKENKDHCEGDAEKFKEFRATLLNLTSVTSKYFKNLVVGLENDLAEAETWEKTSLIGSIIK